MNIAYQNKSHLLKCWDITTHNSSTLREQCFARFIHRDTCLVVASTSGHTWETGLWTVLSSDWAVLGGIHSAETPSGAPRSGHRTHQSDDKAVNLSTDIASSKRWTSPVLSFHHGSLLVSGRLWRITVLLAGPLTAGKEQTTVNNLS